MMKPFLLYIITEIAINYIIYKPNNSFGDLKSEVNVKLKIERHILPNKPGGQGTLALCC